MKRFFLSFLFLTFFFCSFSQKIIDVTLLTSFKPGVSESDLSDLEELKIQFLETKVRALGSSDKSTSDSKILTSRSLIITVKSEFDHESVKEMCLSSNLFKYVELDQHLEGDEVPNDPRFSTNQYYHFSDGTYNNVNNHTAVADADMDTDLAWDITTGNTEVVLGVFDTGLRLDHPEFAGRLWVNENEIPNNGVDDDNNGYIDDVNGWDFVNDDNNPTDDHSHGTNVTGLVAATGDNGVGLAGMDWKCRIMVLKVLNENNSGLFSQEIEAIYYAADNGIHIGNMSLGGSTRTQAFEDAINYADSKGILIVASMGNNDYEVKHYPAGYAPVMAVGATHPDDVRVSKSNGTGNWGSNYGDYIDVVAAGSRMNSARHNDVNSYSFYKSGTSQSTPLVAGLACLIKGLDMTKTPAEIREIIRNTAEDQVGDPLEDVEGYDKFYGYGRINAYQALLAAQANADLVANFSPNKVSVCGEAVVFTDQSVGSPTSWSWNFGDDASPQTANGKGPHTVQYTNGGSKNVSLTVSDGAESDTEVKNDLINVFDGLADIQGVQSVLPNSTHSYSIEPVEGVSEYIWSVQNGAEIISGDLTSQVTISFGEASGEISVLIQSPCGGEEFTDIFVAVDPALSTGGTVKKERLVVFPNPSEDGFFNLSESVSYEVFNSSGENIISSKGGRVDLSSHPAGVYFLVSEEKHYKLMN